MARRERSLLTLPRLILCEGAADEAFLRALARQRGLPEVSIRHPGDIDPTGRGSIDKLGTLLRGIAAWRGYEQVTDILIVADNDADPAANFARVQRQIADTGLPVPPTPLAVAEAPGAPRLQVAMLPWTDQPGTLETLCLPAARAVDPAVASCADAYAGCVAATGRDHAHRAAAMTLRVLLAGAQPSNPGIGLGNVWRDRPALIPLDHPTFNRIAAVLRGFAAGVTAPGKPGKAP